MSITGQTYYTVVVANEETNDKKTPATAKKQSASAQQAVKVVKPEEVKAPEVKTTGTSKSAVDVFNDIKSVGDQIRDLKTKKAPKVRYSLDSSF